MTTSVIPLARTILVKAHAQTNRVSSFAMYFILTAALLVYAGCTQNNIPAALDSVTAEDGTTWERVTQPGFGNDKNISVAAIGEYKGRIYATTRNDDEGAEVWRTNGESWEQVEIVPGFKHGIYGNTMLNNLWSKMIVFKGKLYVGFSAGLQGTVLKSSGCEIWRYDGTSWEPVVSDKVDVDDEGAITGISGCDENDGEWLYPAAGVSVEAHLRKLEKDGVVVRTGDDWILTA